MGSFETFSKRRLAQERAGAPDVFAYDQLPNPFRAQVVHIWKDLIGEWTDLVRFKEQGDVNRAWTEIRDILARERGCFYLFNPHCNQCEDCFGFMLNGDVDGCLDLIEITFRWIDRVTRETCNAPSQCDDAIVELNHRFHEHAIGYEYTGGKLVRVDSQYLHAEVIKPALSLLSRPGYEGANEEFRKAHEHYRHSRFKEALVAAENAFESTLKSVCLAKNYHLPANATASKLIDTVMQNGLVPAELQSEFTSLQSLLTSGLPTVRNRNSGHGQGPKPVQVPAYIAGFGLHLAAANILLLAMAASE